MQIAGHQLFTGDDGQTHWATEVIDLGAVTDVTPDAVFDAGSVGAADVAIIRFAPGFVAPFHVTPTPTWMFITTGRIEISASDGELRVLSGGDFVRFLDHTGPGHASQVLDGEPVVVVTAGAAL